MEKKNKEIPFGAKDSEQYKFEYPIPEGYEARIEGNKVILERKESEDEKIRKFLINYFECIKSTLSDGVWKGFQIEKIFAYINRQKEQKPVQYDIDVLEKHITKDSVSELAHTVIVRNGWEIVEKEQNPAEWSEEDKVMLNNIIWGVHMKSIKPLDEMDDRSKYERYEDFLKALPERFNLQPRTEWSEEDENRFRNLIYLVEDSNEGKGTKEGFVKFINRLKSLRPNPHWKPSEYQMKALEDAKMRMSLDGYGICPLLQSLLDDLKKL